jgi:hypothetical protein
MIHHRQRLPLRSKRAMTSFVSIPSLMIFNATATGRPFLIG